MIEIGKKIAELRKERHWTQEKLADKLHMSKQIISLYESGKRRPSYESLEELADLFNVDMSTFLTNDEQRIELQRIRIQNGISARTVKDKTEPISENALDNIINQLRDFRNTVPNNLKPDEWALVRDFRMLTPKQQQNLRMFIDNMLDKGE